MLDYKKILMENIFYLATLFLFIGIIFYIYLPSAYSFVGEVLIMGGFFGVLVYFIVNRHEEYILREKILGIGGGNLLARLAERTGAPLDYIYEQREITLKFLDIGKDKWGVGMSDQIGLGVRDRDVNDLIITIPVELGKKELSISITDKKTGTKRPANPELLSDISTLKSKYYKINYDFKANQSYYLEIDCKYPKPKMNPQEDYAEFVVPIQTNETFLTIEFPKGIAQNVKSDAFIQDTRFRKIMDLGCRVENNSLIIYEEGYKNHLGPLLPGSRIMFKYETKSLL